MVHLRSLALWLGVIAVVEGLFALILSVVFSREAGLEGIGGDAVALAGSLLPAGLVGLLLWLAMSVLTAHRRAAAEAALQSASRAH